MKTWMQWLVRALLSAVMCAFLLGTAGRAKADVISFQLTSTKMTTTSGGTVTFDGTVTNNSGTDLNASEFFFDFFGFEPVFVNPVQIIGVMTDFLIPNGTTSSTVGLFEVTLGSVPAASTFPVDVLLQDVNSDSSAVQTVTVSVPGVMQTPEPATLLLFGAGLVTALAMVYRQKLLLSIALMFTILPSLAMAQGPVFTTKPPTTGNSANSFFVFLPVANIGTGAASNMQLTSVALDHMGVQATTTLQPATLPFVTGSGYLGPTGVRTLDLEFDNSKLITGNTYLLTLRGTYQAGGTTLGFVLNRPVVYVEGFAGTHKQLTDAIFAKFDSRPRIDPQVDDEAMLAFVNGLPQVGAADLQVDPPLVSVTFNDGGQPLILLNNVKPPPQPFLSTAARPGPGSNARKEVLRSSSEVKPNTADLALGTELPMSKQVRVLNALGSGFEDASSDIELWLTLNGYTPVSGAKASEKGLRKIGGEGVFYISTHAGGYNNFFLWTTTPWEVACEPNNHSNYCSDPTLTADMIDHFVVRAMVDDTFDKETHDWHAEDHFGINAAFMEAYWDDFGENALVYIDACNTDSTLARNVINVLFEKHASVFVGWTDKVGDIAADTARLVFDRLLGANAFCPEDGLPCHLGYAFPPVFAQRPFDYPQVAIDLPLHSLGNDIAPLSVLNFVPNPEAPGFALLAPSISNMSVDESKGQSGQLTINGIFGQDPRPDGKVQVGGMSANIESWETNSIVVDLDSSGPRSAGDVQVTVREHKSNVARLTEWRGQKFTFTIQGSGSLQLTTNFNLHFRTDIRKYRKVIHDPPSEPNGGNNAANDSTGTYSASGSGPGTDVTYKWSGSGTLVYATPRTPPTGLTIFGAVAQIVDSTHLSGAVVAASEANAGAVCTEVFPPPAPPDVSPLPVEGPSNLGPPFGLPLPWWFDFKLDPDKADILQGTATSLGANSYFFCMDSSASATYGFKWGPVPATPKTAPDPQSAR